MAYKFRIGDYPKEYNEKVHGPYDPARYYGKADTPFAQVKLSELGSWTTRRNMGPRAIAGLFSRGFWRWQHKYLLPKHNGVAPFLQFAIGGSVLFYFLNMKRIREHKNKKYHW